VNIKTRDPFSNPRIASPDGILIIQSIADTWPNNSLSKYKVVTRVSPMGIKPPEGIITWNFWAVELAL
jgi:hypothetical protein